MTATKAKRPARAKKRAKKTSVKKPEVEIVKYVPADKCVIRSKDAQPIGEMLEENRLRNGGQINFEQVIEGKDDPTAPHHRYFTRGVRAAAAKQWMSEAHYIVRNIRIEKVQYREVDGGDTEKHIQKVRCFVAHQETPFSPAVYTDITTTMANDSMRNSYYHQLFSYLLSAFQKFCVNTELDSFLEEMKPVLIHIGEKINMTPDDVEAKINTVVKYSMEEMEAMS